MRLLKTQDYFLTFRFEEKEHELFLDLLRIYPLLQSAPREFSRHDKSDTNVEAQTMLDEAVAQQRAENVRNLDAFIKADNRFIRDPEGIRFTVDHFQIEWLLQVLNEIRIASWNILGSPSQDQQRNIKLTPDTTPYVWAMDLSALFQTAFIEALDGESTFEPPPG